MKKDNIEKKEAQEKDGLFELLKAYGESEGMQSPDRAAIDPQLKCFSLHLAEYFQSSTEGTVIDIGCGRGVLLNRIASIPAFFENPNWIYVGTDFPVNHDKVLEIAVKIRLHRRVDVINTDTFLEKWTNKLIAPAPFIIVIRNVLHELNLKETIELFYSLQKHISTKDVLLIQDLLVFPKSERGNACWDISCLEDVLTQLGFTFVNLPEPSSSGISWFTAIIKLPKENKKLSREKVGKIVTACRLNQLNIWRNLTKESFPDLNRRSRQMAFIDFELQRLALYEQLLDSGVLTTTLPDMKDTVSAVDAFRFAIRSYDSSLIPIKDIVDKTVVNFRDRAHSQDALEEYFRSNDNLAVIRGGAFCGKSALVRHVLKRRAYGRVPVILNCENKRSVWSLLEEYLLGIGCDFSIETLRGSSNLKFHQISEELERLIEKAVEHTIIVFKRFEVMLDPDGFISNDEIKNFFQYLVKHPSSKVILTTRFEPKFDNLSINIKIAPPQPYVGRFPEGKFIENILDDYIDRSSNNIDEYPKGLLEAIDRYPYLATLAGKLVRKEGILTLNDPEIIQIIKLMLYDELLSRFITPVAENALKLGSILRVATPRILYHEIVGEESTTAAEQTGLLYQVPDRYRDDMLECASLVRENLRLTDETEWEDEALSIVRERHANIAKQYSIISLNSNRDPRWIREAHYHMLASGDISAIKRFGHLYASELVYAGEISFKFFHDYRTALETLTAAEDLGLTNYNTRRIIASCLIRLKKQSKGEEKYMSLIYDFPDLYGPKTSFIDSLLSIGDYSGALKLLKDFQFDVTDKNTWIAGQYGRAYMGRYRHRDAIQAFLIQLENSNKPDAIIYVRLAQCYYRLGERNEAIKIIERGLKAYPSSPAINTLYCANLIHSGTLEDLNNAEKIIEDILEKFPRNAYVLLKLIKIYELRGQGKKGTERLNSLHWQVNPKHLKEPIEIAIKIARGFHESALKKLDRIDASMEYREALFRRIYLSWIKNEENEVIKKELAVEAIKRKIPKLLETNVPIIAMQIRLAQVAEDDASIKKCFELLNQINSDVANRISQELVFFDLWDDVESVI